MKKRLNFNKYFKITIIFIILSLFISFILYQNLNKLETINTLKDISLILQNKHIAFFSYHFLALILLEISIIIPFGNILFNFYIFFEVTCLNYNLIAFTTIYHFKGFIFSIVYIFLTKIIYLILIYGLYQNSFKLSKIFKESLKNNWGNINLLNNKIHLIIKIFILIIINDLLIYCFINKILYELSFILT